MPITASPPSPAFARADAGTSAERDDLGWLLILIIVVAYALVRLLLVPVDADVSRGFSHDSGYISIVARNVLAGRGFVNDAHWLVFLNPPSLPMAFHNANPLYPLATAATAWLTGVSVSRAGLMVGALANAAFILVLTSVLARVTARRVHALLLAFAIGLFPPILMESLHVTPDMLWLLFAFAFVALLTKSADPGIAAAAGVSFGLAWLTRSTAMLIVPAAIVYSIAAFGWRAAVRQWIAIGLCALAVVSPWLWHSWKVFGDPLRSDAGYYLIQQIVAHERFGNEVERYWHSTVVPPGLGAIVARDPVAFAAWTLRGIPRICYEFAASLVWRAPLAAAAFGALAALVFTAGWRRLFSRAVLAIAVYAAMAIPVFAVRPADHEDRYLILLTACVLILLAVGAVHALRESPRGSFRWRATATASVALLLVCGWRDASSVVMKRGTAPDNVEYRDRAGQMDRETAHAPVVVQSPYFYAYYTGAQALSIPESDDEFLKAYMRKYNAAFIYLTDDEQRYWRPRWSDTSGLPPWLRVRTRFANATLWAVEPAQ